MWFKTIVKLTLACVCLSSLLLMSSQVEAKCERYPTKSAASFDINLDLPPRERFTHVIKYYENELRVILKLFTDALHKKFPYAIYLLDALGSAIDDLKIPQPYRDELKGIAETMRLPVGDALFVNLVYEFTAYCTGIVAEAEDGQMMHGRNLDYGFVDYLQNITYVAHFYRNNTLLYTSAQIAGFTGILTGHKHRAFTLSLNQRNKGSPLWLNLVIAVLDKKSEPMFVLTRSVMENAASYDEAVQMLAKTDIIATIYFIVAGADQRQGAVITRDPLDVADQWSLSPNRTSGIDDWFLVQTNTDHWIKDPDGRRTASMVSLEHLSQANLTMDSMLDVISAEPVCNKNTIYSVAMSAKDSALTGGFQILLH